MHQLVSDKLTKVCLYAFLLFSATYSISAGANESIGGVFEQVGSPGSIKRTSGDKLIAELDTDIQSMDEVETIDGRIKLKFIDDTLVSLTEHTYMVINEYVYDPDPSKSRMALDFVQGTARFATGGLGLVPKENITVKTPTATIGIRGTDFTTTVDELGRSLVILLPDQRCTDGVRLEEGCAPSGSITITNDGGVQVLTEAFQAVMVSTYEQAPTNPVLLADLDLNMIDNMFIVSEPTEITEAVEEQAEETKGDAGLLDFDGLDANAIEADVLKDTTEDLEFSQLDINFLDVDFLQDLLEVIEEESVKVGGKKKSKGGEESEGSLGTDKITGTALGFDETTQFNTITEDGKIFFFRQVTNTVSIKQQSGNSARIFIEDSNLKDTIICLNDCEGTEIIIIQVD